MGGPYIVIWLNWVMKTTLDIDDTLLMRAKGLSKRSGVTLRSLVEEGLRHVLSEHAAKPERYELPDCSVGDPHASNPLEAWSWPDLRDEIYGGR